MVRKKLRSGSLITEAPEVADARGGRRASESPNTSHDGVPNADDERATAAPRYQPPLLLNISMPTSAPPRLLRLRCILELQLAMDDMGIDQLSTRCCSIISKEYRPCSSRARHKHTPLPRPSARRRALGQAFMMTRLSAPSGPGASTNDGPIDLPVRSSYWIQPQRHNSRRNALESDPFAEIGAKPARAGAVTRRQMPFEQLAHLFESNE